MNPTPSPSPTQAASAVPAEWWQIVAALGPLAVLLAAAVGAFMAWRTLRQKAIADDRAEWWKRTQWALDAVLSGDKKRGTVGLKVLSVLGESELAGPGELAVLEASWQKPLGDAEQKLAEKTLAEQIDRDDASGGQHQVTIPVLNASVTLAQQADLPGFWNVRPIPAEQVPGVDDKPGPGDNEHEDLAAADEGGAR
ncbi:MAG TPA: hypothetical protein VFD99_00985 [Arthrobacter sp.]|nr:hypothetical protein [Arthrobacter sp.]